MLTNELKINKINIFYILSSFQRILLFYLKLSCFIIFCIISVSLYFMSLFSCILYFLSLFPVFHISLFSCILYFSWAGIKSTRHRKTTQSLFDGNAQQLTKQLYKDWRSTDNIQCIIYYSVYMGVKETDPRLENEMQEVGTTI